VPGESFTLLVFDLDGQRYGLPASDVQELLRAVAVVPLLEAPAGVEGVINLRGRVVPVLSGRACFRRPHRPLDPADHFIVARGGDRLVALRVDRALDLVQLDSSAVERGDRVLPGAATAGWVARLPDGLVPVHDVQSLLARPEYTGLEERLARAEPAAEKGGGP
jgi:purine-binding chemotaxis protein CheW